jgi:hypothetical protein
MVSSVVFGELRRGLLSSTVFDRTAISLRKKSKKFS